MGLIRVVDDFLISVPRAGEAHGERTVEAMQRKYGKVTYEWDPTSYVGWTIVRKAQHGPIMIHMAPHVEQAAKQFMPWLLTGEKNPRGRARSSKSLQSSRTFSSQNCRFLDSCLIRRRCSSRSACSTPTCWRPT